MNTRFQNRTIVFGAVLAAASLAFADTPRASFSQTIDNATAVPVTETQKEVSRLLNDIHSSVARTVVHAERIQSWAMQPSGVTAEAHQLELMQARELINAKGRTLLRLNELRSEALPWQSQAIDRLKPMLVDLAAHTTEAIDLLNQSSNNRHWNNYRGVIKNMAAAANNARDLISTKLDYVEARTKLDQLESSGIVR